MPQSIPFTKLSKPLESLFVPELKMRMRCLSYPMKSERGSTSVPRFFMQLGKEIIWDFPKDFPLDGEYPYWASQIGISDLIRDYIDAPLSGLLKTNFEREQVRVIRQYIGHSHQDNYDFPLGLTDLFKAADRRLGKKKLLDWGKAGVNPKVKMILEKRFNPSK